MFAVVLSCEVHFSQYVEHQTVRNLVLIIPLFSWLRCSPTISISHSTLSPLQFFKLQTSSWGAHSVPSFLSHNPVLIPVSLFLTQRLYSARAP